MLIYGIKSEDAAIKKAAYCTKYGGKLAVQKCTVTGNYFVESFPVSLHGSSQLIAVIENGKKRI